MKILNKILVLTFLTSLSLSVSAQQKEIDAIKKKITSFSQAYVDADYDAMANAYTIDGRILPPGPDIISGREAIKQRWILPSNTIILKHVATPEEIKIIGDYAYDVGYKDVYN